MKGLPDIGSRTHRIAHVMQGIEHGHEPVVATRELFRRSDAEINIGDLLLLQRGDSLRRSKPSAHQIHRMQI